MLLDSELQQITSRLTQSQISNTQVSQASVHWHLAHSLLVLIRVIDQLQKSDPKQYRWRPNLARTYIFLLGFIPGEEGVHLRW